MSFSFELKLGQHTVEKTTFPRLHGRRELKTSGGARIGELVLTPRGLTLKIDADAAQAIVDAQFHTND